jgi:16S rRNA (cytosine967-C5)-methyltransferase
MNETVSYDNPRKSAHYLLSCGLKNNNYSAQTLDEHIKRKKFKNDSDISLLTKLYYGVAEKKTEFDYIIDYLTNGKKTSPNARVILYIGLYQLKYLSNIPAHAAINESVNLAGSKGERGYVNAILRASLKGDIPYPDKDYDYINYLSVKYSYPENICAHCVDLFGDAEAESFFASLNNKVGIALNINTLKIPQADYTELLNKNNLAFRVSELSENCILLDEGIPVSRIPGFTEGFCFIQDESSQICADVLCAESNDLVIDVCSAPGSKSFASAIRMNNKGKIFSFDKTEKKIAFIKDGANRLGIKIIESSARDALNPDEALFGKADRVLCDVPCSGLGVMAKKPDIRYKSLNGVKELAELQYSILQNSAQYLKPQGILVYSTCTVGAFENDNVVRKFLAQNRNFRALDFRVDDYESKDGMLHLLPHIHGTDGFFIARMLCCEPNEK